MAIGLLDNFIYCRNSGDASEDSLTSEYLAFVDLVTVNPKLFNYFRFCLSNIKAGSDFRNACLTNISVEERLEGTEEATFFFVPSYFLFRLGPGDG